MGLHKVFNSMRRALREFVSASQRASKGVASIEFAVVTPMLALMMVSTADLGMGIYRKMQVQNAAQAGAEYAVAHGFSASISTAVTNATTYNAIAASPAPSEFCGCPSHSGVTSVSCDSACRNGAAAGTYVTVSAQGTYNTILSYPLIPGKFVFTSQATVRIQ